MRSRADILKAVEAADDHGELEDDGDYIIAYLSTIKELQKIVVELLLDMRQE